ncbi:phage holin family protein [Caldimonas sp. KR1-144]|uniref:phage holin family protein n=1 Tax=Caldimonas sp. KR1-144 TaxID=3400911 RepID=UPI003C084804
MSDDTGLLASLRRLSATLVEMAQVRLELIGTELEQEKLRLAAALMWAGVAAVLLGVGTLLVALLVVLLFWDSHRIAALAVLALASLGGAVLAWRAARSRWQAPRGAFAASVDELARDRSALSPQRPEGNAP